MRADDAMDTGSDFEAAVETSSKQQQKSYVTTRRAWAAQVASMNKKGN
jgi:hypothetical protein